MNELTKADELKSLDNTFESFRTYLLYVALSLKGSQGVAGAEGASDLVQQTMLVALRRVQEGAGPGKASSELKAWLRQILVNVMREKARRSLRQPVEIQGTVIDSAESPSAAIVQFEQSSAMERALMRLSDDERELIVWKCVEELSYEEIGRRRGYSGVNAKKVIIQILTRLRLDITE